MKTAVVSAVYGNYTSVPPAPLENNSFLFTDNIDIPAPGWTKLFVPQPYQPRLAARRPKTVPFHYLPQYETVVWIDASITVKDPTFITKAAKAPTDESPLAVLPHPDRDCLYDEIDACLSLDKYADQTAQLKAQYQAYEEMNYPRHAGLYATTVIAWKQAKGYDWLGRQWWAHCNAHSSADQVSLPLLLRLSHMKPRVMPINLLDNEYFDWRNKFDE